jgi:hypothetical protein
MFVLLYVRGVASLHFPPLPEGHLDSLQPDGEGIISEAASGFFVRQVAINER